MSKTMNKAIFLLILMVSFVLFFTGCDLWTLNEQKVKNQKVATIDEISVTYDDVYKAYYSYGNYYFDNQGTPTYNGMKSTTTQLVNKEVLLKALKDKDSKYYTTLTQKQINDVWSELYSELNSALLEYQKNIMDKDGKTVADLSTDEEEKTYDNNYEKPYAEYEKTYELKYENNEYQLVKKQKPEDVVTVSNDVFQFTDEEMTGFDSLEAKLASMTLEAKATRATENFKTIFWTHGSDQDKNSKGEFYSSLAFNKLISVLKSNEIDKSQNMEAKYVFYRNLDKTFDSLYDSALISAFQENFEKTQTISKELVLSTFRDLAKAQGETYRNSENNYSAFVSAMKSKNDAMLYFDKINEWFQVSHVLLKYSDEDVETLKALQQKYKDGGFSTEKQYKDEVAKVKNSMKFTDRKDGNKYSAQEVLQMIRDAMGIYVDGTGNVSYAANKTAEDRIKAFNDFIYRFNMDDGANNAAFSYAVPTDYKNDGMVTPFANAARDLHSAGVVGSISDLIEVESIYGYKDNDGNTQTPSYSGMHIVIYLGEYDVLNTTGAASLEDLNAYILNPLNNNATNSKTMLDYVIEKINADNFNDYQNSVLQTLKGNKEIKYDEAVLKDLVKAFTK